MLRPLNTSNSLGTNYSQVNDMMRQINNEQITKVFKQANGPAIIEGKLPYDGGIGTLYYATNGVPFMLLGIAPDGTPGLFISDPAVNSVLDAFS